MSELSRNQRKLISIENKIFKFSSLLKTDLPDDVRQAMEMDQDEVFVDAIEKADAFNRELLIYYRLHLLDQIIDKLIATSIVSSREAVEIFNLAMPSETTTVDENLQEERVTFDLPGPSIRDIGRRISASNDRDLIKVWEKFTNSHTLKVLPKKAYGFPSAKSKFLTSTFGKAVISHKFSIVSNVLTMFSHSTRLGIALDVMLRPSYGREYFHVMVWRYLKKNDLSLLENLGVDKKMIKTITLSKEILENFQASFLTFPASIEILIMKTVDHMMDKREVVASTDSFFKKLDNLDFETAIINAIIFYRFSITTFRIIKDERVPVDFLLKFLNRKLPKYIESLEEKAETKVEEIEPEEIEIVEDRLKDYILYHAEYGFDKSSDQESEVQIEKKRFEERRYNLLKLRYLKAFLLDSGFEFVRCGKGSHMIYRKNENTVVVPEHKNLKKGTAESIVRQAKQ